MTAYFSTTERDKRGNGGKMKVSEKTKERLIDMAASAANLIKAFFYVGLSVYLLVKSVIVLSQPGYFFLLKYAAAVVCLLAGALLFRNELQKELPSERRALKRRQEIIDQTIDEIIEEKKMWGK